MDTMKIVEMLNVLYSKMKESDADVREKIGYTSAITDILRELNK